MAGLIRPADGDDGGAENRPRERPERPERNQREWRVQRISSALSARKAVAGRVIADPLESDRVAMSRKPLRSQAAERTCRPAPVSRQFRKYLGYMAIRRAPLFLRILDVDRFEAGNICEPGALSLERKELAS